MRRLLAILAALVIATAADVRANSIRDIDIKLVLHKDGSASVSERWDVDVDEGTEWYLVRNNLGDIQISNFRVRETGMQFESMSEWDIDLSRKEKKGKSGINYTSSGLELCWGIGDYGEHLYEVSYKMSNVVKSLQDYDMLHLQLVSPGLSSRPEHVIVRIEAEGIQLDTSKTRAWGFGYVGETRFEDGAVVLESSERFRSNSSIIALLRFEKGMFNSNSVQDRSFAEVEAIAAEGSDFSDEEDMSFGDILGIVLLVFVLPLLIVIFAISYSLRKKRMQILGVSKIEDLGWGRELAFDGDLCKSQYVLKKLGEEKKPNALASALILRMIYNGAIKVVKESDKKIELAFNDIEKYKLEAAAAKLYEMMKKAAGGDEILQSKEFYNWSSKNSNLSEVHNWVKFCNTEGANRMRAGGYLQGKTFTASGKTEAMKLMSLRNFLKDYTIMEAKGSSEAVLWKEYLVFAALFGIADKVAEQLKEINPQMFEEAFGYDYPTMRSIIILNNNLSSSITNASASHQMNTASGGSAGGFGGRSSFGGGGGFSGGGFGGGAR